MSQISDLYHYFGSDLVVSSLGDLQTVSGTVRGQQRVLRRLLTNPGDYLAHPDYGGGLAQFIGQPLDTGKITAVIRSQLLLESSVAQQPAPVITVQPLAFDPTAISVMIQYNDAAINSPVVLSFSLLK